MALKTLLAMHNVGEAKKSMSACEGQGAACPALKDISE